MKNRRSFVKTSGMGILAGVIAPTLQAQNSEVSEKNGIDQKGLSILFVGESYMGQTCKGLSGKR
jgi:hypothetical protein